MIEPATLKSIPSIREIHDAYDRRELSPVELTTRYLDAAKKSDLGAYLTTSDARAIDQARAAERRLDGGAKVPRAEQPLFGIPLGIKDVLTIEGVATTAGSRILEGYLPPYTATAVARLEAAGAISLGKLNCDEFAMGSTNENSAYGPVKHPTHPAHVPGGSSGGSAAAVRAGLCLAALGSDTGGSVRQPASYCGVVGLKPTYGRVSRYGLIAYASSLDQVGPITSSVVDSAILLDAMGGHDPLDSTSAPEAPGHYAQAALREPDWARLRVGVPEEYFASGGLQPEVERSVRAALDAMAARGAKLVPVSLPHSKYAVATYYLIAVSEASSNLARFDGVRFGPRPASAAMAGNLEEYYRQVRALFGTEVKRRIILGTFALSAGYSDQYYYRACQVRRLIRQDFERAFAQVDVIAGPVAPTTAPKLGSQTGDPLTMYLSDIFTVPANLAGIPAISVPCGADGAGLPIGLQLLARDFDEERLLSVAAGYERARP